MGLNRSMSGMRSEEGGQGGVAHGTATAKAGNPIQAESVWGHICLCEENRFYSMSSGDPLEDLEVGKCCFSEKSSGSL